MGDFQGFEEGWLRDDFESAAFNISGNGPLDTFTAAESPSAVFTQLPLLDLPTQALFSNTTALPDFTAASIELDQLQSSVNVYICVMKQH
jgi:hypothetical protein